MIAFNIGRDKKDPEKAVLPTLLFISSRSFPEYKNARGFMFAIGWWDFSIKLGIYWRGA